MGARPTIFVQIASYRDTECQWTVKDLFAKARYPERVYVGVCAQCYPDADQDCFVEPSPRPLQTKVVSVLPTESLGVCWARAKVQELFEDQDYILMIDSHMRFIPGWDEALIEEIARCPSPKSFLSTYPPGYKPPNQLEPTPRPVVMRSKAFNERGDIRFEGETLVATPEKPLRGAFLAGGFIFAPGKFVREVPYDPYFYFDHEEITLAARAFTHGWDVYHPPKTFLYHYYNQPAKGDQRPAHWQDNRDWGKLQKLSRARYNYLLAGVPSESAEALAEISRYGLGTVRALSEYEAFSGLDFKAKNASERARKSGFIEGLEKYRQRAAAASTPSVTPGMAAGLAPLSSLGVGDLLPPFQLYDDTGTRREVQLFAGKPSFYIILPSAFDDFVNEFMALYRPKVGVFQDLGVRIYFLAPVKASEALDFRKRYDIPQGVMADEGAALARAFGAAERIHDTPFSCAVDVNQRIVSVWKNRNAQNHLGDILREAKRLKELKEKPPLQLPAPAPILVVPDVLSADDRKSIIEFWEKGKQYAGTIGSEGKEKVVASGKRRIDVDVNDRAFLAWLDSIMVKRLYPELRKVFALDVTYRERYKIGCYTAEDAGYYNQHRDTGVAALSYRRVSVSFLLNDAFEGGNLIMPEYGPQAAFRAPAGGALCFPSAVLHGVTPVTSGKRFVMVSFLHGDLEENWRRAYHEQVGRKYDKEGLRVSCARTYPGLSYSEDYYTRSQTS